MQQHYTITHFHGAKTQALRNVQLPSPCLIQIIQGSKQLHWHGATHTLSTSSLLLCKRASTLSFENQTQHGRFLSRMFSFHHAPSEAMLQLSMDNDKQLTLPMIKATLPLQASLNALSQFDLHSMSEQTQAYWLMGLYQQFAEQGALHHLFSSHHISLSEQLSRYLANKPSDKFDLDNVAKHFAMSRATLIRKLKAEGTQYRELLRNVRLNHALSLAQQGQHDLAILAERCGYQSLARFSERFKGKFGLSPKHYIKTLPSDLKHAQRPSFG